MTVAPSLLAGIPLALRDPLLAQFRAISSNYLEMRWEPAELNGGKFAETVYTILDGAISGNFAAAPSKPANMLSACRALENVPPKPGRVGDRSIRILIPRVLPVLYEIRNNRSVGHVGGDVDPNHLDATAVFEMSRWVLAELVRIFHGIPVQEAQEAVEALIERRTPLVWDAGNSRRVLNPSLSARDQALVLLYHTSGWVADALLCSWIEYSSPSMFRTRVLNPLHEARMLEYDRKARLVRISPLGISEVEERLIKSA